MSSTEPCQWIGILIDGRLFGLPEHEADATAAILKHGFHVVFASDLPDTKRKPNSGN